jgi:hypothetical protein
MTSQFVSRLAGAALLLAAAGCGSSDTQGPDPQHYGGATVQPIPENVISAAVLVRATGYDSAAIEYRAGSDPAQTTPAVAFAGDTLVRIPVLGLDTATTYTFRIVLAASGAADRVVDSLSFATGSLPAWIPAIGAIGTSSEAGYLALSLPDGVVMVDNAGTVVWYHQATPSVLHSFQAHPAGVYTLSGNTAAAQTQFLLLNALGEEIGTLACVGRPTRFHEVLVAAGGDAWLLCDETRTMDLTAEGGNAAAQVTGTVVQHLTAEGALDWEWNAFDHFAITDLPQADRTGHNVNFTHGNGLGFDTDGNLLLGFRSLSEMTKVDVATGAVLWRFGGLANEFTIANDPKGQFERQHGVRAAGAGRVQALDNGLVAPSRLVRYQLDTGTMTATMDWQFIDAPTTWTSVGGSTQYHPDGHATVSFGQAGRVIEVDGSGNRAWEVTGLDGVYVFRVQRLGSLYTAGRGEPTR